MRSNQLIILTLVLLFSVFSSWAQNEVTPSNVTSIPVGISRDMKNFRYLTVNDGFSRNSVFQIMQDKKGFMWFSLWDGLYRFDGNKLVCAVPNNETHDKPKRTINSFLTDGNNRIWMGTNHGVYIWNAALQKNTKFNQKTVDGDSISGYVSYLHKDAFNNIWFISKGKRLFIYSLEKKQLKDLSLLFKNKAFRIDEIFIDADNQILLNTNNGIVQMLDSCQTTRNPFDVEHWILKRPALFQQLSHLFIHKIYQDSRKNYWIGTSSNIFHIIPQENGEAPQIQKFGNNRKDITRIRVSSIKEGDNCIYAATNQGLFTYKLDTEEALWNLPNYTEEHHLNDKSLTDICIDDEGGLWIASFYGGVNYLHPSNTNFTQHIDLNKYIEGHVISGITEDKYHNVWMAVEDGGICRWNRKDNTIQNFNGSSNTKYKPTFANVQSIYADNDYLYVGMYLGGLDVVNLKTFEYQNFNTKNTRPTRLPNSIYSFHKIAPNTMLIGTIDGLYSLNTKLTRVHKIKEVAGKINCIAEDESGDIWLSSLEHGFYRYSKAKNKWQNYKDDPNDSIPSIGNSITSIYPMNPSIYIGTHGNGLWIFNKDVQTFHQVAPHIFKNAIIFTILQKGETLWITTNKGLFAYNINAQEAKQYTIQDGLQSNQFKENSGIITSDDLFIIGGLNGFNCFRPALLKNNSKLPQVILTDFYLFNKSANINDKECPLRQSITYTDEIDMNQKHHSFAFKFSSSSYSDISKNKFEYKLEPFEKDWQRPHGNNDMASYTNLPAGKYVFHVRTSNGQGAWSKERCVHINIHPFWWLSWPMKMVYVLLSICILTRLVIRYRNKKKKEMHLFRMEKEQEVYQSKMQFFTYMVHEIRTPLTLILGPLNSAMNKKEHTVKEVLPDLKIIERNGKRLLSLVNQLMDFRKIETKSFSLQIEDYDIKEIIKQISKDFGFYNVQKPVNFEFDLPQTECWAKIDREAFTKILANLLSNAMKFTTDWIKVSLKLTPDGIFWELSVADNGKGIPADEQDSVFDSFYQVHQDMPGDYVGTGIGLFVVRRLTNCLGGDIHVKSEINAGATFVATFPIAPVPATRPVVVESNEEENNEPQVKQTPQQPTVNLRKRLLIAEDNEEMREYIASLFRDTYDIDTFENGKTALAATRTISYDLVVTDLMMPIMDGMTLCRTLKHQATTCHIPVIILTAKDDEISQKEGFESEADMYVTKPFSAEVLQSRVKSIFRNREHLRKQFYSEPETTAEVLYTNEADKAFLEKLDDLISQKLSDCNLPIDNLATEMAMGRSVFYQKVKGVTGLTPNDYIRTFRLKKAVALFQKGETRINEVCYRVGFSSPSYFTKRFTQQFGISPSDFLKNHASNKM